MTSCLFIDCILPIVLVMAQSFPPPSDTSSKVELSISCSNLKNLDYFSKSDPVVFLYTKVQADWVKVGRTEFIDNNLNPKVGCVQWARSTHQQLVANWPSNSLIHGTVVPPLQVVRVHMSSYVYTICTGIT